MTISFPTAALYAFLLVLARVAGFIALLPVPGLRAAPDTVRVVLAVAIAIALFPIWPALPAETPSIWELVAWAVCEAAFGLTAGIMVSLLTEGFQIAVQVAGLQAGYGYASTIDPNSEADSSVLQVIVSLTTSVLFFTTGVDHQLLRVLAASFTWFPAGSWTLPAGTAAGNTAATMDAIIHLGAAMFTTGIRLAFPIVALLLLIDIALALVGRVQQQLQLLSLAFPGKMVAALALLAALAPVVPKLFSADASRGLAVLWKSIGR